MRIIYLIAFLAIFIAMVFVPSCGIDEGAPGDTCWHQNAKECGETDSGQDVVLWCDDEVWKIWTYCQKGEICTTMNPYPGNQTPMAHCEDGNY